MKHSLGALLGLLPLAAHADLIFVDYEGTVDRVENPDNNPELPYAVGDHVTRRFTIDTALAGPDLSRSAGGSAYGWSGEPLGVLDFVFTDLIASSVRGAGRARRT